MVLARLEAAKVVKAAKVDTAVPRVALLAKAAATAVVDLHAVAVAMDPVALKAAVAALPDKVSRVL